MDSELLRSDKVNILLVDDTPENVTALEALLESLGQNVVKAYSGADALRRILADDFAVILLDVRMPGMDGLEVATLIRQRERSRDTPIIFLTAFHDDEKLIRGYDLGAVDFLVKPIDQDVLKSKVRFFIELAKKTQLLERHAELLETKNRQLQSAIAQRAKAEEEVRVLNRRLEERLAELRTVNQELEELYRKVKDLDELKTRFFANVSHDMRTPLALMLGPTERLLKSGGLTADQRRSIETLDRHTRALLNHINDLLDLSRLDAGKMDLDYAKVDLAQIVRLAAANFESLAQQRGIAFSVETPEAVAAQLDQEKLCRILLNLFANAFKHAPDGGKVQCKLRAEGARALIAVADNGPGVPADFREAIFERFRRGASGSQRISSTGLGLAIAKEFVTLLGGTVGVTEIAKEGGALFTVDLPLTAPAGVEVREASPTSGDSDTVTQALEELRSIRKNGHDVSRKRGETGAALPASGKPMLLVIEDNPAMRRFITEALTGDFQVETASDGGDGLAKALAIRPDLILTDVMLPTMRGDDLVREIRSRPELEGVPLVVLTGLADEELRMRLLREGAQDYLTKPFSVAELGQRVRNLVAMARARELLQNELESRSQDLEKLAAELALRKREAEAAHAEAAAANRAKDDFLATVSHELRTPLTAVLGWVRLLRTRPFDEPSMKQALETIDRNASIQARLIDEILDVSRIVSGKLGLEFRTVDLRRVIEAAMDVIRPAAEAKGIQLEAELDPKARSTWGDPGRLQQVVWNLLSNAVKFTPKGGRVEVRLTRVGSQAEIVISDTGQGIDPQFLPQIFERFRQADPSDMRSPGGLGLGLAIVSHLVERHNGTVRAWSPGEGQGAKFTISLPMLAAGAGELSAAGSEGPPRASPASKEDRPLEGLRVLVVDDEADTRDVLTQVLEQCGAQVTAATSVAEGVEALVQNPPDVILSDIQMPDQDGYALIRKVKEIEAEGGRSIPAAALTAHVRAEDRMRALAAGFQRHVSKPVEPAELVAVVADLTGRRAA